MDRGLPEGRSPVAAPTFASVTFTFLAILVIQTVSLAAPGLARSVESPSGTSRAAAWGLGDQLGLVALLNSIGMPLQKSNEELDKLRQVANELGASIPQFPSRSGDLGQNVNEILRYLENVEKSIGNKLNLNYPPDHAALFGLAINSRILHFLYSPEDISIRGTAIATKITDHATKARLPEELWVPLVRKVNRKALREEVTAAVESMNSAIKNNLMQGILSQ